MRPTLAAIVALGLVAACSDGSESESPPDAPATSAPVDDEATTPDSDEATPPPAGDTVPPPPGDTMFEQLANLGDEGALSPLDVALAELTAYAGPIPGVPTLEQDGTVLPSLTHVSLEIDFARDDLTPEQATAVDDAFERIFPADAVRDEFLLFEERDAEGFAPRGLVSSAPSSPDVDEAPADLRDAVLGAAESVRSYLGGPSLQIFVQTYEYGARGDVAGRNIGLSLTDPRREELPGNPDCLLQLATGTTVADIAGIVAHEITHCWQFTRLGFDVRTFNAAAEWAIEGQAAYIGNVIGGVTRYNPSWWRFYLTQLDANGQWNLFGSSYDAVGFWARIDAGSDVVAAMRRTLDAAPGDAAMYQAATSDLGAQIAWLGAGTFQRADWGGGWTASGGGDPGTPRPAQSNTVIERNDIALSVDAGAQVNHEIEVRPVAGADGTVATATGQGIGVLRSGSEDIALGGSYVEEWCLGSCVCPDGTAAFPPGRTEAGEFTMWASLVGQASNSTTLRVRVAEFDPDDPERCEEEEEDEPAPTPEPDGDLGGLIGTWRADPDAIAQSFTLASGFGPDAAGLDIAGVTGDLLLTFDAGGTGALSYNGVTLFLNDEVLGDVTLDGGGTIAWTISGGSVVVDGIDYAVSVGSSALGGEILTITDEDVPASGTTRLSGGVTGNQLVFTSADGSEGAVFFPILWTRQ